MDSQTQGICALGDGLLEREAACSMIPRDMIVFTGAVGSARAGLPVPLPREAGWGTVSSANTVRLPLQQCVRRYGQVTTRHVCRHATSV